MEDLINNNEECIICLEEFNQNKNIVILNCGHKFHEDCINKWFCFDIKNNKKDFFQYNACPMCNKGTTIKKRYKRLRNLEYEKNKNIEVNECCCVIL